MSKKGSPWVHSWIKILQTFKLNIDGAWLVSNHGYIIYLLNKSWWNK